MSVLSLQFNSKLNYASPIREDYARKVNYDADGNEFITYEKVDYPGIQASLGTADMWSLDSLVKAGINPSFGIHTGYGTRLEGLNDLNSAVSELNSFLDAETAPTE